MRNSSPPLIQLALDCLDKDKALSLAEECIDFIDIIEIGTPCIKINGASIIDEISALAKGKPILVDLKTMDAGDYETNPFFEAGASICTVLGAASMETIRGALNAANRHGAELQVDLINVKDKIDTAISVASIGVQIIGIHTGIDSQAEGETPFKDLNSIRQLNLPSRISVAGGISQSSAPHAASLGADIIVVGGAVTSSSHPKDVAQKIRSSVF